MNLSKAYSYLFYKFYILAQSLPTKFPQAAGIYCVTMLETIFLAALSIFYSDFFSPNLSSGFKVLIGVAVLVLSIFNSAFINKPKWKIHAKEFNRWSEYESNQGTAIVFSLMIFVITCLVVASQLAPGGK